MQHHLTVLTFASFVFTGCSSDATSDHTATETANLASFAKLDFEAFSGKDLDSFRHIHCADVVVTSPDGSQTTGIDAHVQYIQYLYSWAPDVVISAHPIETADGDWTAVTGDMQATFSQPMQMQDGSVVQPTNKMFNSPLATFARWKDGCIAEEQLFLDNLSLLAQIGVSPSS